LQTPTNGRLRKVQRGATKSYVYLTLICGWVDEQGSHRNSVVWARFWEYQENDRFWNYLFVAVEYFFK